MDNKCKYQEFSNPWIDNTKQPQEKHIMNLKYKIIKCNDEKINNTDYCLNHQKKD